jgi:hypothetical protein
MTSIEVITTRFTKGTFVKGLIQVDPETKDLQETNYLTEHTFRADNIISEDTPVSECGPSWVNWRKAIHFKGRLDDAGEYDRL